MLSKMPVWHYVFEQPCNSRMSKGLLIRNEEILVTRITSIEICATAKGRVPDALPFGA